MFSQKVLPKGLGRKLKNRGTGDSFQMPKETVEVGRPLLNPPQCVPIVQVKQLRPRGTECSA